MSPQLKKALKIIFGILAVLIILMTAVIVFIVIKMPSIGQLRKLVKEPQKQEQKYEKTDQAQDTTQQVESIDEKKSDTIDLVETSQGKNNNKEAILRTIADDFANKEVPLASVCINLTHAPQSKYLQDSKNANAKYFMQSISSQKIEENDLAIESAAPILRYFFRAPGIDYLIDTILKLPENPTKEEASEIIQKAELLANIYKAYNYLKSNTAELNSVVQRSHDLNVLVKAVAAKPELAQDPAVQSFCQEMEDNLNNMGEYNAEAQKQELLKLLQAYNINPKSINYDPNYKANIEIKMSENNLSMNDKWLTEFFAEDIKKAESSRK